MWCVIYLQHFRPDQTSFFPEGVSRRVFSILHNLQKRSTESLEARLFFWSEFFSQCNSYLRRILLPSALVKNVNHNACNSHSWRILYPSASQKNLNLNVAFFQDRICFVAFCLYVTYMLCIWLFHFYLDLYRLLESLIQKKFIRYHKN